jgi:hypothetical protein
MFRDDNTISIRVSTTRAIACLKPMFAFVFISPIMTSNVRSMPLLVIDTCPSIDKQLDGKRVHESNRKHVRSWSLPTGNHTYKDLHGAVHYSWSHRLNQFLIRSRSYPNPYLNMFYRTNGKHSQLPSPSASIHTNINCLDPNISGQQTPGGSSSRYSLYGSFFDLSESGYLQNSLDRHGFKSDSRLLTIGGHSLSIIDHQTRLSSNTFEDKCNDWLRQLQTNSS